MNLILFVHKFLSKYSSRKIYNFFKNLYIKYYNIKYLINIKNFKKPLFKKINFCNFKFFLFLDPKNGEVDRRIFSNGIYEPLILFFLKNNIKKTDIFLDIGANIGLHSIFVSHFCKQVISFEPVNSVFKLMEKSIKKNNIKNIKAYNLGVSNKKEEKIIYENYRNMGGGSIIKRQDYDKKEKIKLVKLDNFLKKGNRIDFIKMDIEGFEYFAFLGMEKILKKYKPKIIFEFSKNCYDKINRELGNKILDFLLNINYKLYHIEENKQLKNPKKELRKTYICNLFCEVKK